MVNDGHDGSAPTDRFKRNKSVLFLLVAFSLLLVVPGVAGARDAEQGFGTGSPAADLALKRQVEQSSVVVESADGTTVEVPCSLEKNVISCTDGDVRMVGIINSELDGTRSASRTRGDVRIEVTGTDLVVTKWRSRARQYQFDGCVVPGAYFWARPSGGWLNLVAAYQYNGPCVEVPPFPAVSIDWWTTGNGPTGTYADGTELCNTWAPANVFAGMPCITVHD